MKILLAAATEREITPTLSWLREHMVETGENFFTIGDISTQICLTGVGIMAATESLTRALHSAHYHFALQAGVAGAFHRSISLGEVVRVDSEALADLGAEDRDGTLLDVYSLGLAGDNEAPFTDRRLRSIRLEHAEEAALTLPDASWLSGLRHVAGITVQTVSGTANTIATRTARYNADVETMEGAPFHYCCLRAGVPFVQIRAISNYVEPRARDAWRMPEAIAALNTTLIRAMELWSGAPHSTP